jgi:tetratricopeptide (TPR) repeat protein
MKPVLAAVAAAFLLTSSGIAAPEWIKVESSNFELYTSAGERDARDTLELFEQVRDFFMRVKSKITTTRLPVTIVGFRNAKEFAPYKPNDVAAAYYEGDEQRDYIVMGSLGAEHTPVAIHEYMHLLVRHSGLKVPVWLNEGFADVYSTLKPMGGQIVLGLVPAGRAITLARYKWFPLAKLISITHDAPEYNEKDRAGIFYAQSWLLAHMLMLSNDYKNDFTKFVVALSETSDAEKAFELAYHKKLWEVEVDLNSYYRAKSLSGVAFKTRFEKIRIDPAQPATELELGITLAKLKTLLGHYDDATERFTELAKSHPGSAEIEEALAYLYWREDKREEALKHFSRAIAAGGTGWKTYWDYARLLGREGDVNAYTEALRKTLQMKPDLLEARLALGSELLRERSWAQALVTLRDVKNIDAEHASEFFMMMAICEMNLDKPEEARSDAGKARQYAKEPRRQQEIDRIIAFLDRKQDVPPPTPPPTAAPPSEASTSASLQPKHLNIKGNFKRLDCLGKVSRMHIMDGRDTFVLLVRQPSSGQTLKCGAQNAGVSVDYVPGKDDQFGTVGEVSRIEFIE